MDRSRSDISKNTTKNNHRKSLTRIAAAKRVAAERKRKRVEWLEALAEAGIIALLLFFFLWPTEISGASMESTIFTGDRVVISRVMVFMKWISRNDVVVCKASEKTENKDIVKRIIGIPGDRVSIKNGSVYIDGKLLDENFVNGETTGDLDIILDENEYFIMGDNRNVSYDSRAIGPIHKNEMIGKVVFRFFPLNKLKFF